jgi:hypothetical protein
VVPPRDRPAVGRYSRLSDSRISKPQPSQNTGPGLSRCLAC